MLAPDFSRLSPMTGLKRIFSMRGLVELGKAFAKFALVALFAVLFLWSKSGELLMLGSRARRRRHRSRRLAQRPGAAHLRGGARR